MFFRNVIANHQFPQLPGISANDIVRPDGIINAWPEIEIGVIHRDIGIRHRFAVYDGHGVREYKPLSAGNGSCQTIACEVEVFTDRIEDFIPAAIIDRGIEGEPFLKVRLDVIPRMSFGVA